MLVGVLSPSATHILWHLPLFQRLLEEIKLGLGCWRYSFFHLQSPKPHQAQTSQTIFIYLPPAGAHWEADVAALCRGCSSLCLPELLCSSPQAWPRDSSTLRLWLEALAHPRQNKSLQEDEELYRSFSCPPPSLAGTSLLTGIQIWVVLGVLLCHRTATVSGEYQCSLFLTAEAALASGTHAGTTSPNLPSCVGSGKSLISQAVQWISTMALQRSLLSPQSLRNISLEK